MWTRAPGGSDLSCRAIAPTHTFQRLVTVLAAIAVASCSGAPRSAHKFKPVPDKITSVTLAGPLCDAEICRCTDGGDNPGLPDDPGVKRYQFKLGPTDNELWVTVDGAIMYKTVERASECFIVDLRAGKHEVSLRARSETGFAARMTVNEIGKKGLYQTFEFGCGGPDPCTFDYLKSFKASLARYKRQVHDPCGSTKIRAPNWLTAESPDRIHPGDLQLDLTLQVYDFAPRHESGHPECKDRY